MSITGTLLLVALATTAGDTEETRTAPEVRYLDHSDVSRPLRSMRPIPPSFRDMEEHAVRLLPHRHAPSRLTETGDPGLQLVTGPRVKATTGLAFDGVGVPGYAVNGAPPDTVGAVGATQYVQWVNTAFAVYNKTTGAKVYGPVAGSTLWQGFGGRCETDNSGDPIVVYDKLAGRWVLMQFAVEQAPYYQCIAVSTTSDATGAYRRFAYSFGSDFNDYPKAGVWPDGYYVTYNIFASGSTWKGAKVCAYDRVRMLSASGAPGPQQCFQLGAAYGGLLPADLDGKTPPPSGAPNYAMAFDDVNRNALLLWRFKVSWPTPASSTLSGPVRVATQAFTEACNGGTCITQGGTTQKLDSLADRLMYRLAYRNHGDHESLVVNHAVNVSGHSGLRWYEVRSPGTTPVVFQHGTFAPDANHRWMGSIAQDKYGDMLIGYSVSGGTLKPSIRYTGRLAADAKNTLQSEATLVAGGGSQTGGLSRWGDYAAMTVDPVDDCTFWFTTEVLKASGSYNWSTRVASFKFPGCGTQAVFYDGAESATSSFVTAESSSSTMWTRQNSGAYAGAWRWKAGGSTGGNYGINGNARLTTPALDLSGASGATLSYAYKYSTEPSHDFFEVRVSIDGGTTWTTLASASGTSPSYSAWAALRTVDLGAYAGRNNVRIQFRLTSDGATGAFGVALDEVMVTKR